MQILIYIHAAFGAVALLAGFVSIVASKGSAIHRKSGLVFYYSMLVSVLVAMFVAVVPGHQSSFLFAIGIFSLYFVLTGYRALNFRQANPSLRTDKLISIAMVMSGVLMISLPIILTQSVDVILTVFAIIGIVFSVRDLKLFGNPEQLRNDWLKLHLSKMMGAYISATTAFVVVNEIFPSYFGWFIPGIVGGFLIAYWIRKLDNQPRTLANTEGLRP